MSVGKKFFTWGSREFGDVWHGNLTDEDGAYLEIMTGCYTDNQPDFSFMAPDETKTFEQTWYAIADMPDLKNAEKEGAVGFSIEDGTLKVDVYKRQMKYYTYVQFADQRRFPDIEKKEACFYVLESEDLIHWTKPEVCFTKGDFWADSDYWAPEVHMWKGKYYLISSFRAPGTYRRCQCLVSDSPKDPFKPVKMKPVTPDGWHCLDGTLLSLIHI